MQVLTELENGERGLYHLSGISLFGPPAQIQLYGSRGTIKVEFEPEERVFVGRRGDDALHVAEPADDEIGRWRVEEEFIEAIRGQGTVELNSFATGVDYMEFTEAVARSAEAGAALSLPLS